MKKFAKQYDGKTIEDAGAYQSEEFGSLARRFKNALGREFPDFEIAGYRTGHYDVSGFLRKDGICIYFSWNVPRYGRPIDTSKGRSSEGILYRTALTPGDFTGGQNNFCSVEDFGKSVRALHERELRSTAQMEKNEVER